MAQGRGCVLSLSEGLLDQSGADEVIAVGIRPGAGYKIRCELKERKNLATAGSGWYISLSLITAFQALTQGELCGLI